MTMARTICAAAFGVSAAMMPSSLVTDDTITSDDKRMALVLEGCKREFDDAAASHFRQFGVKPGEKYIAEDYGQEHDGRPSYRCWNWVRLPDGNRELIAYALMNDPLKPPPPPKPKPRPEPRGATRFWLD